LFLKTNSVNIKMPNMIGWSMNEVKTYCRLVGITCELNGYGYENNQNILENDVLAINSHLKINLKSIQIE